MELRINDEWGYGHFGASRDGGKRTHKGVDIIARVGYPVFSPVDGVVTKIGLPYEDDPETPTIDEGSYRYVQISSNGYDYRLFYVHPILRVGDAVKQGLTIGVHQDLEPLYNGITPHIHFEIKNKDGGYIDPTPVTIALESAKISIT